MFDIENKKNKRINNATLQRYHDSNNIVCINQILYKSMLRNNNIILDRLKGTNTPIAVYSNR